MPRLPAVKAMLVMLVLGLTATAVGTRATIGGEPSLQLVLQTGHGHFINSVALSGDGKHLVTGSADGTAILWQSSSGKQLRTFLGHSRQNDGVTSVALSGDGQHLITGGHWPCFPIGLPNRAGVKFSVDGHEYVLGKAAGAICTAMAA